MRMYLFVALLFIVVFGAFADDRATTEANRIIRDFAKHEALLGQPVPADFQRTSADEFRSPDGLTMVKTGANNRIFVVYMAAFFWTNSEAARFRGLMYDFVERSGGQRVAPNHYHMRNGNLSVIVEPPERHPDGGFVAGIIIRG